MTKIKIGDVTTVKGNTAPDATRYEVLDVDGFDCFIVEVGTNNKAQRFDTDLLVKVGR